ncbi:hypothetical protein AAFF_G00349550 [Aldrovandia affinis]|uniref:Interleukin n=1 Tax=Aldrovandia affinis TaxID=143900 RepID=A0AAD7SJD2_9TELE|nr:hypothetical protein AAFF_G00349550 [Aldrovandia affinis]
MKMLCSPAQCGTSGHPNCSKSKNYDHPFHEGDILYKICTWSRGSKAKRRVRHTCVFCYFCYCQDCPHNGEIWVLFFLLSCLSASISVAEAERQDFRELRKFLKKHEQVFKNSDAMYYTPSYETRNGEACFNKVLLCYILETQVILYETNGGSTNSLEPMAKDFQLQNDWNKSCSPCEAFEETNSITFIESFRTFMYKMEDVAHSIKDD